MCIVIWRGLGSDLVNLKGLDVMPGSKPSIPSQKEDGYYAERSKSGPDLKVWDFDRAGLSTDSCPLSVQCLARCQKSG